MKVKASLRSRSLLGILAFSIFLFIVVIQATKSSLPSDFVSRYTNLERGYDENGFPRLGRADAPVQVMEFGGWGSPGTAEIYQFTFPILLERIKANEISFIYVPMLTGEGDVSGATLTAFCADQQGKFWEVYDLLFSWRLEFGYDAFNSDRLAEIGGLLGLNSLQMESCMKSHARGEVWNQAHTQGVDTTPTIKINGQQVDWVYNNPEQTIVNFNQAIDSILAASS
jgi:hypothetical protein